MISKTQPFCVIPFTTAFTKGTDRFRDCCSRSPQQISESSTAFENWWQGPELAEFRQSLLNNKQWPNGCDSCKINEKQNSESFRTHAFAATDDQLDFSWPRNWNVNFGNICNLGCWSCHESSSSVIWNHKRRSGISVISDQDPQTVFESRWPDLKQCVLKSYNYHDVVGLTILGGEPTYNRIVKNFLYELGELGLASRTKLEFHTNGTVDPEPILQLHKQKWNHVCMFVSLDAVGKYAEWLRYGCQWSQIENNIEKIKHCADYVEIHCTVSVLNINHLPDLDRFAQQCQLPLKTHVAMDPDFISLSRWDLDRNSLLVSPTAEKFQTYYELIGSSAISGSAEKLRSYIRSFDGVRKPLNSFDPDFASKLGW